MIAATLFRAHARPRPWVLLLGPFLLGGCAAILEPGGKTPAQHLLSMRLFQPAEVKQVMDLKGEPVDAVIAMLGEPNERLNVKDRMVLVWKQVTNWEEQEWVSYQTGSQMVGVAPGGRGAPATPIYQPTYSGHYETRLKGKGCFLDIEIQDSVIVDVETDGTDCANLVRGLRARQARSAS